MQSLSLNISRLRYYVGEAIKLSRHGEAAESLVQMVLLFPKWNRSLLRTPVEDGAPWITYAASNFLRHSLTDQMRVFEWGVGGSTICFAQQARELVSVEHDCKWAEEIRRVMQSVNCCSWTLFVVQPNGSGPLVDADPADPDSYASSSQEYSGRSFREYASLIDRFPDQHFDIVFVDGRARPSCVMHAIPKIRRGGYLFVDDMERVRYAWVVKEMRRLGWRSHNFTGPAPYYSDFKCTGVWQAS